MAWGARQLMVLLTLALLMAGCLHEGSSREPFWGVEMPGDTAPGFTLVDQHGDRFSLNDTAGRVVVMTFIFTHCPDVCPAVTYQLGKLQAALGADYGSDVEIVSVTVDPARDTVAHLANWAADRNASWPHLTSDAPEPEAVMNETVWAPYGVYVEQVPAEEHQHDGDSNTTHQHDGDGNTTGDYGVNHSTILYILDQQGRLRVAWPGLDWTYRDIHHDVELLLQE